jgi:circadian clock protein KaiC
MSAANPSARLPTGIDGLDYVLGGGLPEGRLYLVEGTPGSGKTTLALQLLLEGIRRGASGLYFTLSETRDELVAVAASHGWNLPPEVIREIAPVPIGADLGEPYTLFHPSEVELGEAMKLICDEVNRLEPAILIIDSLAEICLLAQDPLVYRRQILALKHFFSSRRGTVLLLDDQIPGSGEYHFQSLVHGVLFLDQTTPSYGSKRRQLEVVKLRGVAYRDGWHDFRIGQEGIVVFPRLETNGSPQGPRSPLSSGIAELDELLGGGLSRGTSTLFMGPSGVGKSTLAIQYALAAARRGGRAAIYSFDEERSTIFSRTSGLNLDLREHVDAGRITVEQGNPAELSPGKFCHHVRRAVEGGADVVVIDSLNGYLNALPEERLLTMQLHELLSWLNQHGVVALLVMAQHGLVGDGPESPIE